MTVCGAQMVPGSFGVVQKIRSSYTMFFVFKSLNTSYCFLSDTSASGEKQENRQIQAKPRKVPIKYGVSFSGFSKSTPFLGKVMPKYRLSLLSKLMSSDVNLFREIVQA